MSAPPIPQSAATPNTMHPLNAAVLRVTASTTSATTTSNISTLIIKKFRVHLELLSSI